MVYCRMPIQAPQWTEFLTCPVCCNEFDVTLRGPISLGCGHTICKGCLASLHRKQCPFDHTTISIDIESLPVNTALLQLVGAAAGGKGNNDGEDSVVDFKVISREVSFTILPKMVNKVCYLIVFCFAFVSAKNKTNDVCDV